MTDTMYSYIELSDIKISLGVVDSASNIQTENLPTRARRIVKEGNVIVSSISGSLESSALITKKQEDFLCSTGFYVLDLKDVYLPEVLLLLMKSWPIQLLLERGCSGTILNSISKAELMKIPLPKINEEKQKQISELLKGAHKSYHRARELLGETVEVIEKKIENSN